MTYKWRSEDSFHEFIIILQHVCPGLYLLCSDPVDSALTLWAVSQASQWSFKIGTSIPPSLFMVATWFEILFVYG